MKKSDSAQSIQDGQTIHTIQADKACSPPEWALLQRLLFDTINTAALEFAKRYTRDDHTLIWRDEWPGMDGSDDPYEGFMNFPLFYALGGNEEVHRVSRDIWEAITWQWTQYGQIHNEFDKYYDWMHHGESSLIFYFFGLADPHALKERQRAMKFSAMYIGEDPEAPNYDAEKKLIRSPITGSKGPRFEQTAEDWETHREILDNYLPPFDDIPGVDPNKMRCPWTDDSTYNEILQRINARMAKGDVPLNLISTGLVTHAYMYTHDDKYMQWVLEYLEAWKERTVRNGGITPDNVGLNGEIGEYNDGKWWGGYYGWRWPHGNFPILEAEIVAGSNAVLLTGDFSHLDLARSQLDMLWSLRKKVDDNWRTPNKHYDDGWRDYRIPHPMFPLFLWNISMAEEDVERAERGWTEEFNTLDTRYSSYSLHTTGGHMGYNGNTAQWFRYIRGLDPNFPVNMLRMNFEIVRSQLEKIRSDEFDPYKRDHYEESMTIHQWQILMPVIIEGLAQLTLGGPMHVYHGGFQHARVRYYDAAAQRPGLPESVAALVEQLTADSVTLQLVNTSLFDPKDVVIQAGTFGEHMFNSVTVLNATESASSSESNNTEILTQESKWLNVHIKPGCGIQLRLGMRRYVNKPSYETPWKKLYATDIHVIHGRKQ